MFALLLGIFIGLLTVIPIGPLSMTIIGVATERGPVGGLHAALGVVTGDVVLGAAAVVLVSGGQTMPGAVFSGLQIGSAVLVVGFGLVLASRVSEMKTLAGRVRRPALTLFLMTVLSPAIGSWVALLLASPFTDHDRSLATFAVGIAVSSLIWHPALGAGVGYLAPRLTERRLVRLARVGGVSMAMVGVALLAA